PHVLAYSPRRHVDHADGRLGEVELRHLAELLGELRAGDDRVEERRVNRVHRVLEDLEPVAGIEVRPAGHDAIARSIEAVVDGKWRLLVRWTQVGEDDAARLVRRIRAVTEALLQRAVRRLAGGLEQRAVDVEEPAVVAAPDAALGDEPELERGAA